MKIGFVIPYWTTWGGSARVVQEVTKRLAAEGLDIVVFTTDVGAGGERVELGSEADGVSIRSFRNVSYRLARRHRAFFPPAFFRAFSKDVSSLDVVHVVDHRHLLGSWALRRAKSAGVSSVLAPHGSIPNAGERLRLKGGYDRLIGGRDLRLARHFHALTDAEAVVIESRGIQPNQISVISNGLSLPTSIDSAERARARTSFGLDDEDVALLYMGRIVRQKGLLLLLDAVGQLATDGVRVKLLVAGSDDGELSTAQQFVARNDLADRVQFLGFVDGLRKREVFAASDVFALWSSFEAQPMAVLEAMSYGLCTVVSPAAAVIGMVESQAGIALREQNVSEGVGVLAGLMKSPEERASLGARGRALIDREFSWSRVIPEYIAMYERVIGAN